MAVVARWGVWPLRRVVGEVLEEAGGWLRVGGSGTGSGLEAEQVEVEAAAPEA